MTRWRHDDDDGGDPRTWCSRGTGTECSLRPWSVSTHSLRWPGPDVVIAALLPATVDAHTRVTRVLACAVHSSFSLSQCHTAM